MRLYDNSRTVQDEAAILADFQQRSQRSLHTIPTAAMPMASIRDTNTMCSPAASPMRRCWCSFTEAIGNGVTKAILASSSTRLWQQGLT